MIIEDIVSTLIQVISSDLSWFTVNLDGDLSPFSLGDYLTGLGLIVAIFPLRDYKWDFIAGVRDDIKPSALLSSVSFIFLVLDLLNIGYEWFEIISFLGLVGAFTWMVSNRLFWFDRLYKHNPKKFFNQCDKYLKTGKKDYISYAGDVILANIHDILEDFYTHHKVDMDNSDHFKQQKHISWEIMEYIMAHPQFILCMMSYNIITLRKICQVYTNTILEDNDTYYPYYIFFTKLLVCSLKSKDSFIRRIYN